jgi:signal transduction histidine kinase
MGVQSLLASTELTEEQRHYVDILTESNRLVLDIIQSILDPSLNNEEPAISFHHLLEKALIPYRIIANSKGIQIIIDIEKHLPLPPLLPSRMFRIMGNLMDNALKYTEQGKITITAYQYIHSNQQKDIHFIVTDTGEGIPPERLVEIRKGQVKPDEQFMFSKGLGLVGIQELVKEEGGTFTIESIQRVGTTIHIVFPL